MTEDQSFYDGVDALHREAAAHAIRLSDLENAVAALADRLKVSGLSDLIPVPDAVRVEDVVLTLAGQVDDLRRLIYKLQDANLAPVLESSAVLVELRRIADAAERQVAALETLGTVVEPRHKPSDTPAYIRHRGVS